MKRKTKSTKKKAQVAKAHAARKSSKNQKHKQRQKKCGRRSNHASSPQSSRHPCKTRKSVRRNTVSDRKEQKEEEKQQHILQKLDTSCMCDNGHNLSNHVHPESVLRSILHDSFPILYLPEFISRRCTHEVSNAQSGGHGSDVCFELPSNIKAEYHEFLAASYTGMKESSSSSSSDDKENDAKCNNLSQVKHVRYRDSSTHLFVRAIVIPLSSNLVSKVARPSVLTERKKKTMNENNINRGKATEIPSSRRLGCILGSGENPVEKKTTSRQSTNVVINRYKQPRSKPKLFRLNESLISLVDGVISTLVMKKQRFKGKERMKYNKKKKSFYRKMDDSSELTYDELCYGSNLLAEGYGLGSSDEVTGYNSLGSKFKRRRVVSHCTNMSIGVRCSHLNSCASYARCAPIMNAIHNILGDDLMRELLLHSIILIPIGESDQNNESNNQEQEIISINSGNYFQLCGPPLSLINLNARPDTFSKQRNASISQHGSHTTSKKRKRSNEDIFASKIPDGNCTINAKTVEKFDPHWIISRNSLFYSESFVKHVGLPPSHILNQWNKENPNNDKVTQQLLSAIVKLSTTKGKRCRRWRRLRTRGMAICKKILQRHNKCDYARLLERYCPLPKDFVSGQQQKPGSRGKDFKIVDLVGCQSNSDNVISFLCAVLKNVFPLEFWGSERNFQRVLESMACFIKLRRREQYPLKTILHGISVLDVEWLFRPKPESHQGSPASHQRRRVVKSDHEAGSSFVANQMQWLYCGFLVPLIRSTFYVTDTEFGGKQTIYYRKPVWSKLKGLAMDELLQKQYREISKKKAHKLYSKQHMGFSRLRILPKKTGFRPIAMLSRNEPVIFSEKREDEGKYIQEIDQRSKLCTNSTLKQTLDVLKFEYSLNPSRFGVGVLGFHRIFHKISSFVQELKRVSSTQGIDTPLYFSSVDIHKCYDNINQDHLFDIIKEVMTEDNYLIQQNTILHQHRSKNVVNRKRIKTIGRPGKVIQLPKSAENLVQGFSEAIVLDSSGSRTVSKNSLLNLLQEHLSSHVVVSRNKYGPKFLLQKSGIPQGSVLSTKLCNYYYGDNSIEEYMLKGLFEADEKDAKKHAHLLMRVVDDFLLVTTNQEVSKKFMERMVRGHPDLGVRINEVKSRVSHDTHILKTTSAVGSPEEEYRTLKSSLLKRGDDTFFQWCGVLMNTKSFSVHVDYSRFIGTSASDTLTIDRAGNEGIRLQARMKSFIRPRCQPLFYDTNINSKSDIETNFYQAIAFAAIKSVNYISEGMEGGSTRNISFIFNSMIDTIKYAYGLISSHFDRVRSTSENTTIWLDREDALWLGCHSFQSVLRSTNKKDILKLCFYFSNFYSQIKTRSSREYLTNIANDALKKFDLKLFEY